MAVRSTPYAMLARDVTKQAVGRCMVFAPHPDDEVLGCGGTIAKKRRQGTDVHIVHMTDGRKSHDASLIDPQELVSIREQEARAAAAALGVSADCIDFLSYEDSRLGESIGPAVSSVQALLEKVRPQEVYMPYRKEFQSEHVATHRIVVEALRRGRLLVQTYEYPVWSWPTVSWRRSWSRLRSIREMTSTLAMVTHLVDVVRIVKVDISDTLDVKQRALSEYRSQVTRFRGPSWPMLPPDFVGRFLVPYEIFFRSDTHASPASFC